MWNLRKQNKHKMKLCKKEVKERGSIFDDYYKIQKYLSYALFDWPEQKLVYKKAGNCAYFIISIYVLFCQVTITTVQKHYFYNF